MYDNVGRLCFHFHISLLCPLARCNRLNTARSQCFTTQKQCVPLVFISSWMTTSCCHPPQNIFSLQSSHSWHVMSKQWQEYVFVHRQMVCKRQKGSREREETKWQDACSASMKSEWWVEGPMGEEAVLLSVRLEYWYMATAALPNQAKPPDFLCAAT